MAFFHLFVANLRRSWLISLIAALGIFAFQVIMVRVFVTVIQKQASTIASAMPRGLQSFFGIQGTPIGSLQGFLSIAYQHPFLLAAMIAIPIAVVSALLAGEIERRTLTLLLVRPVARTTIVTAAMVVTLLLCALLVAAAIAGTYAGAIWMNADVSPVRKQLPLLAANLWALMAAISGICIAISALADERGDAIGWTFTIVAVMYVWNFLAQVWPEAKPYADYTLFQFYSPPAVLRGVRPLPWDYQVLLGTAAVGYVIALVSFRIREFRI